MNTKEKIINISLELFSVGGYDAVSMRDIAHSVGIRQSSIYKHFKSKQDILDTIVKECEEKINKMFVDLNVPGGIDAVDMGINRYEVMTLEELVDLCCGVFLIQAEDKQIEMFKRLLIIEQYKNKELANIYHEIFFERPLRSQKKIFAHLIEKGILKKENPEVLALEYFAPFFAIRHRYGEEYEREKDILSQHIKKFIKDNIRMDED